MVYALSIIYEWVALITVFSPKAFVLSLKTGSLIRSISESKRTDTFFSYPVKIDANADPLFFLF
jgi:hypothetical protein